MIDVLLGWLTVIGWQAALAAAVYVSADLIRALLVLDKPEYAPHPWHVVLIFWVIILLCGIINTVIGHLLPKFEGLIFILHLFGFFAILLPLVMLGPHRDARQVFHAFRNGGAWPTQGLSFMIGIIGSVFAFGGKFVEGQSYDQDDVSAAATR